MNQSGRAGVGVEDEAQRGREAALLLMDAEEHPGAIKGSSQEFAEAALDEIEHLQKTRFRGVGKRMLGGFHRALKAKNPDPAHGLVEVFQNADDQGATELRLALRRRKSGSQLLLVHNGERMRLDHIIGIVFPGVSSKLDDADALGRYGIGLKILYRLGGPLAAHCSPFHFEVETAGLHRTSQESAIPGFYDPDRQETLLVLNLDKRYGKNFFVDWLEQWDASSLLFLRRLRSIKLVDLASGSPLVEHTLKQTAESELKLRLRGKPVPAKRVVLRDAAGRRSWTRYLVTIPTVKGIERDGEKETGKTTTIAVAVPARPSRGRLHVGFRLAEPSSLPFSLNAQFDPDDSRSRLLETEWNAWLLDELAELVSAVMLERFGESPARGWGLVPRSMEQLGEDGSWLRSKGAAISELPRAACLERLRLDGRRRLALADLVYESGELDKMLREDELEVLAPDHAALRTEWRDGDGRWREVMDDLEVGETIDADSLLLDLDERVFESRDPEWFVRVADAGLESSYLDMAPWIVTSDGRRHSPERVRSESVLILKREADGLAAKLGIAKQIDSAFLAPNEAARRVEKWLGEKRLLILKLPTRAATLAALAARDSEDEPIPLGSNDTLLREIRDALDELRDREELSASEREDLAKQIGANITVDGREWRKGKRVKIAVRPSEAYLPRSIDTTEDGFPAAADRTPGLKWIDPRYSTLFRGDEGSSAHRTRRPGQKALAGTPRPSGARAFFWALGAEVSPRLRRRPATQTRYSTSAATIPMPLSVEHEHAIAGFNRPHLYEDWDSADLDSVITDIAKAKKTDRQRRAKILLATIARRTNWTRLYHEHVWVNVVSFPYTGRPIWTGKTIRATWAASAASVAWMSSQSGRAKAPRDLALRTDAFIALHGEQPDLFAWGLEESDSDLPVLGAFAIEGRPQAQTIVERLESLRDDEMAGEEIDRDQVARCYAALARYCPGGLDEEQSDLDPRQLQGRFRRGPGLVRSQSGWRPPREVFRGQDIFGGRRPHVATAGAEQLWETVGVRVPSLEDCAAVLRDLARTKTTPAPQGTLIAIYQHLSGLVREAKKQSAPRALASLPLWTDQGWRPSRSVYAVLDLPLERALAENGVPVWRPPCRPEKLRDLLAALDVPIVEGRAAEPIAPDAAATVLGSEFLDDFTSAVEHLKDRLVERNFELHSQLGIDWDELREAEVAISEDLQQRIALPGRKAVTVPSEAFFLRDPLTLGVRSEEALGMADAAGNAVAALFESADAESRDYLALAWEKAWSAAISGERAVGIEVAAAEDVGDPLAEWQNDPNRPNTRGRMQRDSLKSKAKRAGSKASAAPAEPSKLATLESILARLPHHHYNNSSNGGNAEPRKRSAVKLRPPQPNGNAIGPSNRPPGGGKDYDNADVQQRGLEVLDDRMWEWYKLDLSDQHKFALVGSDAVDEFAGFWVELKAHAGEVPDSETLTAAEGKRAVMEGKRYLLAVVSGLAEGATPDVRIFADPIHTLNPSFDRSIRVSGIRSNPGLTKISSAPRSSRGRATSKE